MNKQSGMSIMEILVACAILGLVARGYSAYQGNLFRSLGMLRIEGEKEDLRNRMRMTLGPIACMNTMSAADVPGTPLPIEAAQPLPPLPPNAPSAALSPPIGLKSQCRAADGSGPLNFVALRDVLDNVVISDFTGSIPNATKIGDNRVRAYCINADRSYIVHVEARRMNAAGTLPLTDPLTGIASEWKELFVDAPLTCEFQKVHLGYMDAADVINRVMFGSHYDQFNSTKRLLNPDSHGTGGRQMPYYDGPARRRVCEYLGYAHVAWSQPSNYSSCGNDDIFKWNPAMQKWVLIANACAANVNHWIGQMVCQP